jgi:hypothetical protein
MNAAQSSLKSIRIIRIGFLLTVVLYLWVPTLIAHEPTKESPFVFVLVFAMLSLTSVGAALFFQARLVRPAAEQLKANSDDQQAAARWRTGLILCFVFSESVVLSGLGMRFLGAPWEIAGLFYAVGALLLLACTPKLDRFPQ